MSSRHLQTRTYSTITFPDVFQAQLVFPSRLTSILVSRFLLNIQTVDRKSTGMVSSTGSQVESTLFKRVVGSLGSEVEFGADACVASIEEDRVRGEDGMMEDIENSLSGPERPEQGAAEEAVADD